ncbi:MAG TPA: hypothetical protein VN963_00835 [bacterium]|nr:hypothetical protein [bacterium]
MKSRISFIFLLFVTLSGLTLTGCKDEKVAPWVLPPFCDHFPDTTIYDFDKRILWIQTQVDGISSSTAETMFKEGCVQAENIKGIIKVKINSELTIAGKQVLIIGFNHYWVVWSVRNGVDYQGVPLNYQVMDYQTFHNWFTQKLGYMPTPDQIRVITLQNVQETPKGQPMQLQTLAEIQQQKSQQPQEGQSPMPPMPSPEAQPPLPPQ